MADTGDKSSSGGELKDILHGGTDVALFGGQRIRRVWLDDRWYFSVVDVVGLLTEAAEPRTY